MIRVEIRTEAGRKRAIWFGAEGRPLFGFFHPSKDGPWRGVGVVLVRPIGTDHTRCDRPYRHLAERLAEEGFACLRFDLYGTGDSGGDESDPGLVPYWLDDVGRAIDEVRARSGAERVAVVGLRLGATLAHAAAAERGDVDSLVLWSPYVSGAAMLDELSKMHQMYLRLEPDLGKAPPLPSPGREALGLVVPEKAAQDLSKIDLTAIEKRPARRTLLIDGGILPGRDALMARLAALDAAPELRRHPGHKFLITVSQRAEVPHEILDSIAGWLNELYPASVPQQAGAERPDAPAPDGERAMRFGERRPLFGILTPADPARARPGRPAILLTNAASVSRAGPHRLYVRLARRWARLGFDVLRMDLSGIGDSPAAPDVRENLTYPPGAFEDLAAALAALGPRRAVVAGLCSGGDYAFQLAARDAPIAGAVMINPRTFGVLDLPAVESASSAPPSTPAEDVPRSLREAAERGVRLLLLVGRKDPGVNYLDVHAGPAMTGLAVDGYQRIDLDATDHTFTPVAVQERVLEILSDHVLSRHGAG
jgi:alpha-beta hydrolase superfamily lysophospholipase